MDSDDSCDFDEAERALPTDDEAAQAVGIELERMFRANHGSGARRVLASFLGDDGLICVFQGLEFRPVEEVLIDQGDSDLVMEARLRFHQAIESASRAVVEHVTGRRVRSQSYTTCIDPPVSVEYFFFSPRM